MEEITISNGDEEPTIIPLDLDGTLTLATLKEYLPHSNGIVYREDGKKKALQIKDGKVIVNPNVSAYEVNIATKKNKPEENVFNAISAAKREQVLSFRKILENKGFNSEEEKKDVVKKLKISDFKKPVVRDVRQAPHMKQKTRQVFFHWRHRFFAQKNWKNRKESEGGGEKILSLEKSKVYTVKDLTNEALTLYDNDRAKFLIKKSEIKLAFQGTSNEIEKFLDPDGKEIGMFEYIDMYNITASRLNVYLLTTTIEDIEPPSTSDSEQNNSLDSTDFKTLENKEISLPTDSNENLENKLSLNFLSNPAKNEKSLDLNKNKTQLIPDSTKRLSSENSEGKENIHYKKQKVSEYLHKNINQSSNSLSDNSICDDLNQDTTYVEDYVILNNSLKIISIRYWSVTVSTYSREFCFAEEDKFGVINKILADTDVDLDNQHEFDPINNGFNISSITVNGEVLYSVIVNEDSSKNFEFFELCNMKTPQHTLLYDIDIVNGYTEEGYFGIGIIPKCDDICKPWCSWYCNGKLYKKGIMLYWLNYIPSDMVNATWHCNIKCSSGQEINSKKVKIINQSPSFHNPSINIMEINRSELEIFSKDILGVGAQATVCRGLFKGENVAVKTIKTYGYDMKKLDKELLCLQSLNSVNIIKIKGVCKEKKMVHIIMELFEGKKLSDVAMGYEEDFISLHDKNKSKIIQEICKAFCFLHMHKNPIVHRDIKLDNILINEEVSIKIIDFGISTFQNTMTALRTTAGTRTIGTPLYNAPEHVIHKQKHTTKSDVWAIGCAILEIFTGKLMWENMSEEEIKQNYKDQVLPDLSGVPDSIQPVLKECFSYDPKKRPSVFLLYNNLKKNLKF